MNKNIEKELIESIFFVLNEIKLGNLSYRLRPSVYNKDYNAIATYINEVQDIMKKLVRDQPGTSQNLYSEVYMDFSLTDDFCVEQVNDVVLDILNMEQKQIHHLYFDELLTGEYRMVWDTLEDDVLPHLSSPFSFEVSFEINDMVECPASCCFTRHPEDHLIRVSAPKIFTKPAIDSFMDGAYAMKGTNKYIKPYIHQKLSEKTLPRETEEEKATRKTARYIEEHLDAWPSIDELARITGMNREKLRTLFKRIFKMTLYEFYTHKRMEKAKYQLIHTDMPVEEIASVLGYKAPSNFYKAFKKKYGCSPGEMRKKK